MLWLSHHMPSGFQPFRIFADQTCSKVCAWSCRILLHSISRMDDFGMLQSCGSFCCSIQAARSISFAVFQVFAFLSAKYLSIGARISAYFALMISGLAMAVITPKNPTINTVINITVLMYSPIENLWLQILLLIISFCTISNEHFSHILVMCLL